MKRVTLAALVCSALMLFGSSVRAQEDSPIEPDITIKQMEDKVVYEYRVNGFLYAVKVVPKHGKPYYLVAEDNSDNLVRADESGMKIPKWKIFTWD